MFFRWLLVIAGVQTAGFSARADVHELFAGGNFEAAVAALQPGDELVLGGGTYLQSGGRTDVIAHGTAALPIVIRAKVGEKPHITRADEAQNLLDINVDYVTFRGITFSGGSAGLRMEHAVAFTIEDCEIYNTGDVAIRANDTGATYQNLKILRNHIHDTDGTGEGMYLGCNSNGCPVKDSLIEGNYIHHTNGPTVSQGDGIELKEGGYNNIIRDNVIHDTKYPCILVYSTVGNGAANVIERNLMWNCGDHGIQAAADATIRNNIILSAKSDGIAMQPHQAGIPSNLTVLHNTVFDADGDAISLRNPNGSVVIANNALFTNAATALYVSATNTSQIVITNNRVMGSLSGWTGGVATGALSDFVSANFSGAPPCNLFPSTGSGLIGAATATYGVLDDFNGTMRAGSLDVGAYRFNSAGNPGWTLAPAFKVETPVLPPAKKPAAPKNLRFP